jgi:hypothetical protein
MTKLLISLGKQLKQREMRAQKVIWSYTSTLLILPQAQKHAKMLPFIKYEGDVLSLYPAGNSAA